MYSDFNLLQIISCFEFLSDIDNIRSRILTIIFVSAWALYNIFKINILVLFNYSFLDNCTMPFLKIIQWLYSGICPTFGANSILPFYYKLFHRYFAIYFDFSHKNYLPKR